LGILLVIFGSIVTFLQFVGTIHWVEAVTTGDTYVLTYKGIQYLIFGFLPLYFGVKRIRKQTHARK